MLFRGNYGSPLGSFSNAASTLVRGAEMDARKFASIGNTLGQAIGSSLQKFRENKDKRDREIAAENQFLRMYDENPTSPVFQSFGIANREEAKAAAKDISKDPSLVNQAMSFAQNQMTMEQNKMLMEQNRLAQQRQAQAQTGGTQFTDFMLGAGGQATDPTAFLQNIRDARAAGNLNPDATRLAMGRLTNLTDADAAARAAAAESEASFKDFQRRKRFEAELEKEGKEKPPAPNPIYKQSALDAINDALSYIDDDSFSLPATGFGATTLAEVGGTNAAGLKSAIDTITSAVGFTRLDDMRKASPTGGALGQVSERELSQLNASLGSLSQLQKKEQLKKNLLKIKDHYEKAVAAINAQRAGLSFKTQEEAMSYLEQDTREQTPEQRREIEELEKLLKERQGMEQYFNNPNVPNYGNIR